MHDIDEDSAEVIDFNKFLEIISYRIWQMTFLRSVQRFVWFMIRIEEAGLVKMIKNKMNLLMKLCMIVIAQD